MSKLYVLQDTGVMVDSDHRQATIGLLKLLFKLHIVSEPQVVNIAVKFVPMFV